MKVLSLCWKISLGIPRADKEGKEIGMYEQKFIHLPRQDEDTPSKNPVKSMKIGTRTPSSTPFCTPNFLKIPDVTVLF